MNRLATAAAALLLGLCAACPSPAHAEEWRWCAAVDLLDNGHSNGPNLLAGPFRADEAPDFQAQYEAYVRSVMGPIEGEFLLNCSPPFADDGAAIDHYLDWLVSMEGLITYENTRWSPTIAPRNAVDAEALDPGGQVPASVSTPAVSMQQATPTAATAGAQAQSPSEVPTQVNQDAEAARLAEQRRQDWERQRIAAQQGGASNDAGGAAKPLRFVLIMPMLPKAGDAHNPACYSNVITRPGPPGWGAPGFLPAGSGDQANRVIDSLKASFIAQCRAVSGREAQSEGNFRSSWNQTERDEAELANARAQFPEDVTVQLD